MAICDHLTLRQKEELRRLTFLLVGRAFLGGGHCGMVPLAESVTACQREIELLGGAFMGEVTARVRSLLHPAITFALASSASSRVPEAQHILERRDS